MTELRRIVVLVVVLAVLGLSGAYMYIKMTGGAAARVQTAKVERGELSARISTTGTLNAVTTVQVGTQVSGQVSQILVDFNAKVTKGQLIARIDPQAIEARVSQVEAEVEAAEANTLNQRAQLERASADLNGARAQVQNQLSQVERATADVENARAALAAARAQTAKARVALLDARRDLDRKTDLLRSELVSRSERDTAQAAHDSAAAQVEAAEAQERALGSSVRSALAQLASSRTQVDALQSSVRSAEALLQVAEAQIRAAEANVRQKQAVLRQSRVDLAYTAIRSPVDGVVVSRNIDVGQTVAASLSAPTLFTIAQDLTKMQIDTNVDEADIGRIEVGQATEFTVDSFRGERFTGQVQQIRMAPKVVQNVVTYNVVIAVDNANRRLLPGLTATARIIVASRGSVLKVPNAALRFRPDGTPEAAPASGEASGSPAGPLAATASSQEMRQYLRRTLDLTSAQDRALGPILEEHRGVLSGFERVRAPDRRAKFLQVREETQTAIRALLTEQQRRTFDRLPAGQPVGEPPAGRTGTVWVLDPPRSPRAVPVRLGITDTSFSEVLEGPLEEGQLVIVEGPDSSLPSGPRLGALPRPHL